MFIYSLNKKSTFFISVVLLTGAFLHGQSLTLFDSLQQQFDTIIYKDFKTAENLASTIEAKCADHSTNKNCIQSYLNFATLNLLQKDFKNAKLYTQNALEYINTNTLTLKDDKIKLFNSHAYLEYIDLNYEKAITYSEKAINLAKNQKKPQLLAQSYITRANICIGQQRFKVARSYLKKATQVLNNTNYVIEETDIYFSYGKSFYISQKDSALFYYNKALKSAKNSNKLYKEGEIYADMAFIHLYNSETDAVKRLLDQAEVIAIQVGHKALLHNIYYTFGYYYSALEDYNAAVLSYKKAVDDYGDSVSLVQLSNANLMLSYASFDNGNYSDAFHYQGEHTALNDSIFNIKKAKEFETIKTKYEVEKKDNQIQLLEKENELAANKRRLIIIIAVFTTLLLIGLFLFYRQRAKTQKKIRTQEKILYNKETQRLQKEQELVAVKSLIRGQDDERHRIAKELHDGVAGQLASVTISLFNFNLEHNNKKISTILNHLKTTFKELRALSHSLSDTYHKTKSLDTLIAELKQNYEVQDAFKVEVTVFPKDCLKEIPKAITHHIYRILQELLNNTNKYAKATEVQLTFDHIEDTFSVTYEDNGVGFNLETQNNNKSIGLKNIEERVQSLNGTLYIDTKEGRGAHFSVELPLIKI